jgi:hypothetical protein
MVSVPSGERGGGGCVTDHIWALNGLCATLKKTTRSKSL